MPVTPSDLISGLEDIPNQHLAVAVSGGGDSVALLHMLAKRGAGLRAVTVDHGLRDESAAEAIEVNKLCKRLSVDHTTLKWNDWTGKGNLQDAARRVRQDLIGAWGRANNITHVALGHTFDDQAETLLMRLARGSGVDGLSGIAVSRKDDLVTWVRPLLGARRDDLRAYLRGEGIGWIDDPSNDDPRFDRVKARIALGHLRDIGIDADGLVETSKRMRGARRVLEQATVALADETVEISEAGEVGIDRAAFLKAEEELQFRLLAGILRWVSGEQYRPRFDSLRNLLATEQDKTLHGCVIRSSVGKLIVRREAARVQQARPVDAGIWDHRWEINRQEGGRKAENVAMLGEKGLLLCPDWRETGHAREALITTPALWNGEELIAAPLARMPNGWQCRIKDGKKGLNDVLMTR